MPISTITSSVQQVTGVAGNFSDFAMVSGAQYRLSATTDLWYKIAAAPTAQANTANNHFLARGAVAYIAAKGADVKVSVIQDSANGYATLSLVEGVS